MTEEKTSAEGSSWFWKTFGGVVLSILAILFVAILNLGSNQMGKLETEISIHRVAIDSLKEKMTVLDQVKASTSNLETITAKLDALKEKTATNETQIQNAIQDLQELTADLKVVVEQIQKVREKLAATDSTIKATKVELGGVNTVKEAKPNE